MMEFEFDVNNLEEVARVCTTEATTANEIPYPAVFVDGAAINGFNWFYRNDGDRFYVYYTNYAGNDKEFAWEPDSDLARQIPEPSDTVGSVKFALELLTQVIGK